MIDLEQTLNDPLFLEGNTHYTHHALRIQKDKIEPDPFFSAWSQYSAKKNFKQQIILRLIHKVQ